jgi:hypothetical protein
MFLSNAAMLSPNAAMFAAGATLFASKSIALVPEMSQLASYKSQHAPQTSPLPSHQSLLVPDNSLHSLHKSLLTSEKTTGQNQCPVASERLPDTMKRVSYLSCNIVSAGIYQQFQIQKNLYLLLINP